MYQGELSELQVLGIDTQANPSDADIAAALAGADAKLQIRKGDPVMLIQSGAMIPDGEMVQYLEKYLSVNTFSGVPEKQQENNTGYSRALRLAAARAGIGTIIVYWGVLESGVENLATKTVSWVPIVGAGLPDEAQTMRIRLKVAVIDVKSGKWEMFSPEPKDDKAYSGRLTRAAADQAQVAILKKEAYGLAADRIVARFVR